MKRIILSIINATIAVSFARWVTTPDQIVKCWSIIITMIIILIIVESLIFKENE